MKRVTVVEIHSQHGVPVQLAAEVLLLPAETLRRWAHRMGIPVRSSQAHDLMRNCDIGPAEASDDAAFNEGCTP